MKRFKFLAIICCFGFVALAITPQAKADNDDKKTIMTFSEPFEVPGVDAQILPGGHVYLQAGRRGRSIGMSSRIFSADGLHIYTTILAILITVFETD